jgi:cytochrome oxidase assembly protein ShyY1
VPLLLTPRWLAVHLLLLVALGVFGALGWWQFQSYRQERAEAVRVPVTAPPVELPSVLTPGSPLEVPDPVVVRASGTYDAAAQLVVPGRTLAGRSGYLLVTPLRLAEGGVVPVLRGWVERPESDAAAVPAGRVEVVGLLQPNEEDSGIRTDAGTPAGAEISAVSTEELLRRLPFPPNELYDGHVLLTEQSPPAAPAPTPVPPRARVAGALEGWRNLSYAVQWWIFGALALGWWVTSVRDARRARGGEPVPV